MDRDLIIALAARLRAIGATTTKTTNRLRFRKSLLSAEERAAVEANRDALARILAAQAALDETLAAMRAEVDEQARADMAELARRDRERRRQERHDWLATLEPDEVRAGVAAGRLSAADVAEWRVAVEERMARALLIRGIELAATLEGRVARVVERPDGGLMVRVSNF